MADHFWCAVQIQRNSFSVAERGLLRQKIDVFSPKHRVSVRRFGRVHERTSPLFPGYLFVSIDEFQPKWRAVSNTTGVSRIIMQRPGIPARVPPQLIDGLLGRCDPEGYLMPPSAVDVGDRVRISGGPFTQFVATVERVDPQRRVWVLLEFMGGQRAVEVRMDALLPEGF